MQQQSVEPTLLPHQGGAVRARATQLRHHRQRRRLATQTPRPPEGPPNRGGRSSRHGQTRRWVRRGTTTNRQELDRRVRDGQARSSRSTVYQLRSLVTATPRNRAAAGGQRCRENASGAAPRRARLLACVTEDNNAGCVSERDELPGTYVVRWTGENPPGVSCRLAASHLQSPKFHFVNVDHLLSLVRPLCHASQK